MFRPIPLLLVCALAACGTTPDAEPPPDGGTGQEDAGLEPDAGVAPLCEPATVPCEDQVFQNLAFQKSVAPGLITSTAEGAGWKVHVDATAGGFGANPPHAFVYAKFTDTGLQKLELSDEAAIESMEWDIAFRRNFIRINSGNSGPSCVTAFRMPGTPSFESVSAAPEEPSWNRDVYFTDTCEMIADGSGLANSPNLVLSGYYSYPGCLKMTGNVYLLKLRSGRTAKLTVTSYYTPETQPNCQNSGSIGSGSGNINLRWAFLD